jgi:hypothetical protein
MTSFEQLCPPVGRRKLAQFVRQLRRCLRAAEQGRVGLARRLRPADVWIPLEECLCEEARPWDWDTEPLERGEAAVAQSPSEGWPECDVSEHGTRAAGEGFADQAIVEEICNGIDDDADGRLERGTLLCAPHVGGLTFIAQAGEKIAKSVAKGWATEHALVPRWPMRAAPWSVVDESERAGKPKYRLTIDLSWPQPGMIKGVTSVNDASDRQAWPRGRMVRLCELAEAAGIMAASGVPVKVWVLDAVSFYCKYGRRAHQLGRQMMVSAKGRWVLDRRPQFGGAAVADKLGIRAANLNAHHVRRRLREFDEAHPATDALLLRYLEVRRREAEAAAAAAACGLGKVEARWTALGVAACYVDDTTGVSFNDQCGVHEDGTPMMRADEHFRVAREALQELGHESAIEKEQPPAEVRTPLGGEIDVRERRLRLSREKRVRYARCVHEVLRQDVCEYAVFRRLVHRLVFASCMYPIARQWLHACFRVLRARYRLGGGRVLVSDAAQQELQQWAEELARESHQGVPLACVGAMPEHGSPGTAAIYADASGEVGYAAWALRGDVVLLVVGTWTAAQRELLICEKELIASTVGLCTLGPRLDAAFIYEYTDSTVALAAMTSMTPSLEGMQRLVGQRLAMAERHGWRLAARRVSSKNNLWADLGSRGHAAEVAEQARRLGLRVEYLEAVWE